MELIVSPHVGDQVNKILYYFAVSRHPHIKQIHPETIKFTAHAVEARVKDLIEKVSLVAFHRIANYKVGLYLAAYVL